MFFVSYLPSYSQRVQRAIQKTNKKEQEETEEGPGWT